MSKLINVTRFIGIGIFVFILYQIDFSFLFESLKKTNITYFISALFVVLCFLVLRSIRWRLLLRNRNIFLNTIDSFTVNTAGLFYGFITPGRLGDFTVVYYLKKKGHSSTGSFAATLIDRVLDVITLFTVCLLGMYVFPSVFQGRLMLACILISLILVTFVILWNRYSSKKTLRNYWDRFGSNRRIQGTIKDKVLKSVEDVLTSFPKCLNKNRFAIISVTLLIWVTLFFSRYLMIKSLQVEMNIIYLVFCIATSMLVTMVPVSIGGFGTRDAVLIYFFSHSGYEKELALVLSFYIVISYMLTLLIGVFCILYNTKRTF